MTARPHFGWDSPVHFDELDLNGTLHNARYAVHVERAQSALFETLGKGWERFADRDPDLHYAVREMWIEFLAPLRAPGMLRVKLWIEHVGRTSTIYVFRCGDATTTFARGRRTVVKIDPATGRPAPWSDWYRRTIEALRAGRA